MTEEGKQWYTNQELFEKLLELDRKITNLCIEIKRISALIDGKERGSKDVWGYIVGAAGIIFAILFRLGGN